VQGDGNSNKNFRQATATRRAIATATRVVGKEEGKGEGGKSNDYGNKDHNGKEEGDGEQQ
jgi:hypothetical protein